jgi:transposase
MGSAARLAVLSISPSIRIFVHALPTDMRKHFDGLCAIVTQSFGKDVLHGDYFVFLNRSRNRCKILFWDRDGLVVWAKRLERGSFPLPCGCDAASLAVEIDNVTLAMMLGGVDLKNVKRGKRYQALAG